MEISLIKNRELILKGKSGSVAVLPLGLNKKFDEAALKADFILSAGSFQPVEGTPEGFKSFNWPGEMEVAGITVSSLKLFPDQAESALAFILYIDGFTLCYLSDTSKEIPAPVIEKIGDVDLLIFPVTGSKVIHDIIEEIEPKAILPVAEKDAGELDAFITKIGLPKPEVKFKLNISSKGEFKPDAMGLYLLA